jgi:uncharacterized protein with PQ loop repeat
MLPRLVSVLAPLLDIGHRVTHLGSSYHTKKVSHLSYISLGLLLLTSILWLLHGYFIYDLTMIVSAAITVVLDLCLIVIYIIYI